MSARHLTRCHVCGTAAHALEPAVTSMGPRFVCADGEACCRRANGDTRPELALVSAAESETGASTPRPPGETP